MPAPSHPTSPLAWLNNQPYLLLTLASLFWAGNIVLARYVAGHVPPLTLSCIRWIGTFLMLWPFARQHLVRDWRTLLANWPLLLVLALTGFAINNALSYWAMQYTQALNGLLIQSSAPLFVALWSLVLFGVRLTAAQFAGIAMSLTGVLVILLRGDLGALAAIQFNRGDLMFAGALLVFGIYSAVMTRRPAVHQLSLIASCTALGALLLLPLAAWEYSSGFVLQLDLLSVLTLGYVVVFASTLAYLFFNRGIGLIGPNRAAPFLHLVPLFGSVLAILLLGEELKPFHLGGYALVIAGVVIASRVPLRKPGPAPKH
ncbi:putative transport protein; permease of the drug/metabolite transporter (DMT) superfamily [Bradyrhizobium sp. ORS 285]|uniref:DMT family transporter n=1 Tax=Bradyrhizobium sp. ORS 285 TaxID=115808 RepID=UPI0002408F37|nr:DMT family transporter [Bradyrhizobium sp. ORS 285]CCD86288.1 putative transport protein; permease of the drug/metabolite transporter (DMT) superfamily [Bradyrhizobium sp. ORS 285]SMX60683.1 putative transport protein; permease of the drug/metabolite transporter (DMT) superfamily [Bradyrhizobium sp. ORS 285]